MRTLTIGARNLASARGFLDALNGFRAELPLSGDGSYVVRIELDGSDREVIQALNALEEQVTARAAGPARLELDGRRYLMDVDETEPAPDAP